MLSPDPKSLTTLQREVQRKLGRNLIRLQQYEGLVKAMVAEMEICGAAGDLHDIRARQIEVASRKTLGQVVGELTGNYLTMASNIQDSEQEQVTPDDPYRIWFRTTCRLEMTGANFEDAKQQLAEVVALRNELVHHFLDNQDIWTERGCAAADLYLDDCYGKIDGRYDILQGWARTMLDAREYMAGLIQSQEFHDFLVYGILPGGAGVAWESCAIVNRLRISEDAFGKNGWTLLQDAIAHIGREDPELTPKRYGCSSWRHLLHDSRLFEIRREKGSAGSQSQIWYRSRVKA